MYQSMVLKRPQDPVNRNKHQNTYLRPLLVLNNNTYKIKYAWFYNDNLKITWSSQRLPILGIKIRVKKKRAYCQELRMESKQRIEKFKDITDRIN